MGTVPGVVCEEVSGRVDKVDGCVVWSPVKVVDSEGVERFAIVDVCRMVGVDTSAEMVDVVAVRSGVSGMWSVVCGIGLVDVMSSSGEVACVFFVDSEVDASDCVAVFNVETVGAVGTEVVCAADSGV